jgi:hypothetical protein
MRSLSGSLLSAQRSASARPYVKVEVLDKRPDVARPIMERLYSGAEPDHHHAATMPGDGSLVRARLASLGALYVQRVANPGPGSDFSSWTQIDSAWAGANIVLISRGSRVLLFFVDPNNVTMTMRESDNYGATWGSSSVVLNPSEATLYLAASFSTSGVPRLFYISNSQSLWTTRYNGSFWSPPWAWTYTNVHLFKGISCTYDTDWDLVVCGETGTGENKVWTVIYGDGGEQTADVWSPLREHTRASTGSGVEFKNPFIAKPDGFRLSYMESYSGSAPYSRPVLSFSPPDAYFADNRWRDGVPFDLDCTYGIALAHGAEDLWLSTPYGVWYGALASSPLSLTDDVLSFYLHEEDGSGNGLLVLRNDDGRYNGPGSGELYLLRRGSQVETSPGYYTDQGAEASSGPAFWIAGWEHRVSGGRSVFALRLAGGWSLLEGWRARRQFVWAAGEATVREMLTSLLARAGMSLDVISASNALDSYQPEFTVHPGEDGRTAVRRLMALVPDVLFFRGGQACVKLLQPTDVTDYVYGTEHAIFEGRYASSLSAYNRVQAFGLNVTGEAFSWPEVEEAYDRLLQVHDLNLDTETKAQERAEALLHRPGRTDTAEIMVPVNCGQEMYDVAEVTDARLSLSGARYRVLGLDLCFEREKQPRYTHTLTLGGE